MGRIKKNYLYNLAYQLLTLLAPIVTAPYLTRVLGADKLGIYSYVNASGNIITTLALIGIYAYGTRQTAYVRDDRRRLTETFWELELARLMLGAAGTAAYLVYVRFNPAHRFYFLIYYPYLLAQFLDCSWIYVGLEDMKIAVTKNFVTKLVNVCGVFLLVRKREDVWIYILMLAVTTLIANLSVYRQLPRYVDRPAFELRRIPAHLKGSLHLFLPQAASLFYLQVDKVMLKWLTGETGQLSFYDQAEKIITIPLSLITVLSTVMMPRLANEFQKNNRAQIESLLLRAGSFSLFLACPMMLGMLCIARQFIPWYLGEEFLPTAYAMMALVPIVLFNSLSGISGAQYFTATDQIGILLRAYVTAAAANMIVNALLIPRWAYLGAAAATVLSSLLSVAVQYRYLARQVDIRPLRGVTLRYLALSAVMAAAVFALTRKLPASALTTLLQIALGGGIYLGLLALLRDSILFQLLSELKRFFTSRKSEG